MRWSPEAKSKLYVGSQIRITVRCNNWEFRLNDRTCREVLLDAIKKGLEKYEFKLYARLAS